MKKQILSTGVICLFGAASLFATDARIESMGKSSKFIMDDVSIFDNPANIGIFPNYLVGEMGTLDKTNGNTYQPGGPNVDPSPWFGGIFSMYTGDNGNPDPMYTIAGAFNRPDSWFRFFPDKVAYGEGLNDTSVVVPVPVTNFDGFLGGSTKDGNLYGVHVYIGHQDGAITQQNYQIDANAFASVVKINGGINWQLDSLKTLEVAAGIGRIAFGPSEKGFFDASQFSVYGNARIFSTIESLNGELVIAGDGHHIVAGEGMEELYIAPGIGVNVNLDRGFFWLGLEGIYQKNDAQNYSFNNAGELVFDNRDVGDNGTDIREEIGGKISFGIERNIWWDWFVIRVGGSKKISYVECDPAQTNPEGYCLDDKLTPKGTFWATNPIGDGTSGDHIGFGIGINVEERLKVDATLAEDLLYRNPFQGGGVWLSRISASYSF